MLRVPLHSFYCLGVKWKAGVMNVSVMWSKLIRCLFDTCSGTHCLQAPFPLNVTEGSSATDFRSVCVLWIFEFFFFFRHSNVCYFISFLTFSCFLVKSSLNKDSSPPAFFTHQLENSRHALHGNAYCCQVGCEASGQWRTNSFFCAGRNSF